MGFMRFILGVLAFAALVNGAMLYRPEPVRAAPVKVASWLKTDKVQDRLPRQVVKTISYRLDPPAQKTAMLPSSCIRLAAREGERLPASDEEMREAKRKVIRLARKGDALAVQCRRDFNKQENS